MISCYHELKCFYCYNKADMWQKKKKWKMVFITTLMVNICFVPKCDPRWVTLCKNLYIVVNEIICSNFVIIFFSLLFCLRRWRLLIIILENWKPFSSNFTYTSNVITPSSMKWIYLFLFCIRHSVYIEWGQTVCIIIFFLLLHRTQRYNIY